MHFFAFFIIIFYFKKKKKKKKKKKTIALRAYAVTSRRGARGSCDLRARDNFYTRTRAHTQIRWSFDKDDMILKHKTKISNSPSYNKKITLK